MNPFAKSRKSPLPVLQILLVLLLVSLLVVFVAVMLSENPRWISDFLGLSRAEGPETVEGKSKYEALKFIGISMGGVLVALQALIANKRANAMEHTAKAQADAAQAQADAAKAQAKANLHTEQGQRQERLKNAIEHLGHESDSVRLGGAYELFHLAIDIESLRRMVLDILCAHIRWTTGKNEYRETHAWKPSEEVQSLLALLFVRQHDVCKHLSINLEGSWLNGVNLNRARLQKAFLYGTRLRGARLYRAQLQGAVLYKAQMQKVFLGEAHLQGAFLDEAQLQGASLHEAQLKGSFLGNAQLQGASLDKAQLQGAFLGGARLQGASLNNTQLQGVGSMELSPFMEFEDHIRAHTNRNSNLSKVVFAGGLSEEQALSLIEALPREDGNRLWEILQSHIDEPESNQLPKNSTAITGLYTEEDAEKWIAEYNESVSEAPKTLGS